jgi:hypothetical protein
MPEDRTPPNADDKVDVDAMQRARAEARRDKSGSSTIPRKTDDDNVLESLGKAVSAPVLGAADEDPQDPAKPENPTR